MLAAILFSVLQVMFSRDGVVPGSGLRECPSAGVSLRTGNVVLGLHQVDDVRRMECGWYRYDAVPKPDDDHYWAVTGFVFRTEGDLAGTVYPLWGERKPKVRETTYSKLSIIESLEKMNGSAGYATKWDELKAKIVELGLMDKWNACTYISATNATFIAAKPRMIEFLGMTEKQFDEWLEGCRY